ncbi:MAG: hypothetical protein IPN20_11660 [Haliscomenobacter sp.]|nr:hypothetical protein [Haliscomenobacter sp.]
MFSGLEDKVLPVFGDGAVVAVVIDASQGVVEEEFGAVVGVEVEGVTPVSAMST